MIPVHAAPAPERINLKGRLVTLEPLNPDKHGASLWAELTGPENDQLWRYLYDGPFAERSSFDAHLHSKARSSEAVCYAIVDLRSERPLGLASLMRIDRPNRVIEVGSILYSPLLQRTAAATEAMYLLARYVFNDLGYRRYEWKCNALNEPSRRAALRLGFTFEGIFRQHLIVKGENRDTAWFSMLDGEWPARKQAFEAWLAPGNFDEGGNQKRPLSGASSSH